MKVHHAKRYIKAERCSQQQEGSRESNRRGTGRKRCGDDPSFYCTPIVMKESAALSDQLQQAYQGPVSRIWTWEFRVVRRNLRVHIMKPIGVH